MIPHPTPASSRCDGDETVRLDAHLVEDAKIDLLKTTSPKITIQSISNMNSLHLMGIRSSSTWIFSGEQVVVKLTCLIGLTATGKTIPKMV